MWCECVKRMTLLLGPPGAGKTTLLTALAGEPDRNLKVQVLCVAVSVTKFEFVFDGCNHLFLVCDGYNHLFQNLINF